MKLNKGNTILDGHLKVSKVYSYSTIISKFTKKKLIFQNIKNHRDIPSFSDKIKQILKLI